LKKHWNVKILSENLFLLVVVSKKSYLFASIVRSIVRYRAVSYVRLAFDVVGAFVCERLKKGGFGVMMVWMLYEQERKGSSSREKRKMKSNTRKNWVVSGGTRAERIRSPISNTRRWHSKVFLIIQDQKQKRSSDDRTPWHVPMPENKLRKEKRGGKENVKRKSGGYL
jgi:hypothetical protein